MADLRPFGASPESGARERAQLILVAGFVIAVVLIALALVMNSAIYTENLATRSDSSGATDAVVYQRAVESAALEAFEYAHAVDGGDHASLEANVTDAMAGLDAVSAQQEARRGHVPNVSVAGTVHGTAIIDESDDFASEADDANWTVAGGISAVRAFNVFVDGRSDLRERGDDEFRIVANDTANADRWHLNVTKNTSTNEIVVGVAAGGSFETCRHNDDTAWVNVTAGTVAGEPCDALTFAEGVSGSYDLEYRNGTAVRGHYSMVVDNPVGASYASPDAGDPRAEAALYRMTVDLVYRTADLDYRAKIRIEPGDHDG